jgi:hypothetical protein
MVLRRLCALTALTALVMSSGCCHRHCFFRRAWCAPCAPCAPVSCGCESGYAPPPMEAPPMARLPIKGPPIVDDR